MPDNAEGLQKSILEDRLGSNCYDGRLVVVTCYDRRLCAERPALWRQDPEAAMSMSDLNVAYRMSVDEYEELSDPAGHCTDCSSEGPEGGD